MTLVRLSLALAALAMCSFAQAPNLSGDYSGTLGPLHLNLHLKQSGAGSLEGTLDSPDQGAKGLPCANIKLEGANLSFDVPSVNGNWKGTVTSDAATLSGNWSQGGQSAPLNFNKDQPAGKPSKVDGVWLGTLEAGGQHLRIQVNLKSDVTGKEHCTLDSLDQGAIGLPCDNVKFEGNKLSFDVPSVHGNWSGTLSEDANQLTGTWSQGKPLPLNLTRQKAAAGIKPPSYEAAMAPIAAADLKPVLDRDLAQALQTGALSPATGGGVAIGVVQHGKRYVWSYGPVKEDSIFEIGSITKTFTGLILAQMVEQKKVTLETPVRELLPANTVPKPNGPEITLLDLATQHSGLPRMPDNFHPADPSNPYADYTAENLYEFIAKIGLARPSNASFGYSNLGLGLLGQALANCEHTTYPELLAHEVTGPLAMHDTVIKLSPELQQRFALGHDSTHHPAHAWDLDALAGAGAIRSSAGDMLTYLEAQLHPEKTPGTLPQSIPLTHQLRSDIGPGMKIALVWLYNEKTGDYWHNGGTGGYSSFAYFNPREDTAAVVLFNTTVSPESSFADRLGEHIAERLAGRKAVSLFE
ncbi:MAG TPA: serine hydrolase domain-containing protein [Bryobacteraceae bacterium]|nr:serine hydrolase domain-containing protein [Bryobacteraceae bacterium]